ncbi:MAG: hypothetical protein NXI22_21920 [bacterium]|nr:hypothetical protein [bacterium]
MRWQFAVVLFSLLVCIGCGSSQTGAVSGQVTYEGEPLETGRIVFHSTEGPPASGEIENGEIKNVETSGLGAGAPVGSVKIAVQATKPDPKDSTGMNVISIIPTKYADSSTSGLTAEIASGQTTTINIELKK